MKPRKPLERRTPLRSTTGLSRTGGPSSSGPVKPRKSEPCIAEGCDRLQHAHGYCNLHYQRWKKGGSPLTEPPRALAAAANSEMFRRALSPEATADGDCWEWPTYRNAKGYGVCHISGRQMLATRAIWEKVRGPIPAGLLVCHKCDNPPCVRPSHLYLGTHKDNARDMVERGRLVAPLGEEAPNAVIPDAEIPKIRRRRAGGETCKSIAADYGVDPATISKISRHLARAGALGERKARRLVYARSGRACEICGQPATEWHHRRNRSQGGRWTAENGMHLCSKDHLHVTTNPTEAYANGWSVRSFCDPASTPCLRRGQLVWLRSDGTYIPVPLGGAA